MIGAEVKFPNLTKPSGTTTQLHVDYWSAVGVKDVESDITVGVTTPIQ